MLNKNIRLLGVIAMLWGCIMTGQAKNYDDKADTCRFVTNSFWDNWFIQAGVGMSLQNLYGKDFTNPFTGNIIPLETHSSKKMEFIFLQVMLISRFITALINSQSKTPNGGM